MSAKNLVIVESPAKAKTIQKYLGDDFVVESSYGHIRDLPKSGMNIDIEGGTFLPTYEVSSDKKKRVAELKRLAKVAETVWLASDEDREGEAIAWHLQEALKLKPANTKRIVFHEITKGAILKAIESPREVDIGLVNAQQARRVLDRLVGYELSPVLWRKVRTGLSAGRVQSVAVRLIVEREEAIRAFESTSSFRISADFTTEKGTIRAKLTKNLPDAETAEQFLKDCVGASFTITGITKKPAKKKPAAPFTTSTLQQEASRKLYFNVKRTMMVAQRLYEAGLITYMRTDSLNLSETALSGIENVVKAEYGKEFHARRTYKAKSAGAQEAHEAIRPTDFTLRRAGETEEQKRLYELIWKRTVASQMAEAKLERTSMKIGVSTRPEQFSANGEVVLFPGFLEVYIEGSDEEMEEQKGLLPAVAEGDNVVHQGIIARESFTRPPSRYTEAALVKALEEMGIGRPSTYAPTISTIQARNYIAKDEREGEDRGYAVLTLPKESSKIVQEQLTETTGADKNKLWPTEIGEVVSNFLTEHFPKVLDYSFTAKVEAGFDEVATGDADWQAMMADFYTPFKETVEVAKTVDRKKAVGQRLLGIDPETGKNLYVRLGRFGPMVQRGEAGEDAPEDAKPEFASLKPGQRMETVTMEDALELFTLPRLLGQTPEGEDILANFGRFGPYIKFGKLFQSIKPDDPFTITLERAQELVIEKKEKEANRYIHNWEDEDISVQNGRWGPFIKTGKRNVKIPKDRDAASLTLEEVKQIIKETPDKPKRGFKKKIAKPKATTKRTVKAKSKSKKKAS